MNRNLGAFSCYGIDYVFDYLGENRIKIRIQELEKKPTMGISLQDFTYCDAENSYFSGKGILWVFDLLIQWFDDIEFIRFLYDNSKKYNEDNYHNNGLLEKKWNEHIEDLNHFFVNTENSVYMEVNKLNPYWMEYHFFYMQVSKSIIKAFKTLKELKLDLTGEYKYEKNKLRGKVLLELKTRRKPLSGQYLMCKEAFVKYNLDLKELQDYLSIYHFNKDKNLYRLILEKDKLSARIEMLNSHPYAEKTYTILQDIKLDQFWSELTASYINNLKSISLRIKQDYLPRPNTRLSNGILWDIYDFFRKENNHLKAIKIAKLNNLYTNIWKEIPTCP